jgi:Zn-finger nucleic acid-binding protein
MSRRNFGERSGVIVDVCATHGVWFDAGELAKVVEFVATKGLPKDALRRAPSPAAKEQELRAASSPVATDLESGSLASEIAELVSLLLELMTAVGRH